MVGGHPHMVMRLTTAAKDTHTYTYRKKHAAAADRTMRAHIAYTYVHTLYAHAIVAE